MQHGSLVRTMRTRGIQEPWIAWLICSIRKMRLEATIPMTGMKAKVTPMHGIPQGHPAAPDLFSADLCDSVTSMLESWTENGIGC